SPELMFFTTKSERRKTRLLFSASLAPYQTDPNAASAVRIAFTISRNSAGSRENALSGPGFWRESVKCFSTMHAPRVTATAGTAMPSVWSESPAGTLNRDMRSGIVRRFMAVGGEGYALVHLSNARA